VNENIVEQRFVEVGIVGDRDYEVLSGLEEGEEIVIGGFVAISRDLYDGAAITIKKQSENSYKRGGGRPGSGN
jgi:HlyD family secretion protein